MISFLLKRIVILIITLIGMSIIAFSVVNLLEGDPVDAILGERGGSPELRQKLIKQWGFDKPYIVQYGIFIKSAFQGELGRSSVTNLPITEEFFSRLPATIELGLTGLLFAILLGIPMGIMAAVKRNTPIDYGIMGVSLVGYSMPIFWWGLLLIIFFSTTLGITPVDGRLSVHYDIDQVTGFMLIDTLLSDEGFPAFLDAIHHLILPSIALGSIPLAVISRMTRSSLLEVLGEDYIRTAKAKGLSPFKVVGVHALRNALIPVVTIIGLMFGTIAAGAILTETIFSWPGLGRWMVGNVNQLDPFAIRGGILIIATMIMVINMSVDLLYAVIDPRMRAH